MLYTIALWWPHEANSYLGFSNREDMLVAKTKLAVVCAVHERSHGNAHAHRLRIAWQVGGLLKRASHESIPSIHQLRE